MNTLTKRQIIALCEVEYTPGITKGNKTLEFLGTKEYIVYKWHVKNTYECTLTEKGKEIIEKENYGHISKEFMDMLQQTEYAIYLYELAVKSFPNRKDYANLAAWGTALEPLEKAKNEAWKAIQNVLHYNKSYVEFLLLYRIDKFNSVQELEEKLRYGA